jgi:TolA-binding protein
MAENGNSCERCREWLMDILYPEDLERIPADIRQHLDSCAACGEDFEALGRTLKLIRQVDLRIQPPPGLERSIMSAIEREAGARKPVQAPGFIALLWEKIKHAMEAAFPVVRSPAFAAAIVLLVVAGVVLLLKDYMAGKSLTVSDQQQVQVLPPITGEEAAPAAAEPTEQRPPVGLPADKSVTEEKPVAKAPVVTLEKAKEQRSVEEDWTGTAGDLKAAKGKESPKAKDQPVTLLVDDELSGKKGGKAAGPGGGETAPSGAATTPSKLDTKAVGTVGLTETLAEEKSGEAESKKAPETAAGGTAQSTFYPTPTPTPTPPGVSVAEDADYGVGKKKKTSGADTGTAYGSYDKTTANAEKEESVAPTYAEAPAEASMAPPESEGKKKGSGGGWLAKWKEKKAAKKKAKADKAQAAVQEASTVDKAEATKTPSPASPASPAKEAAPAKDPYVQARDNYQSGNYDAALSLLNAVLKDPSSTTTSLAYIYHLLGKVWNKKGNNSKALVYYENLFARYPSYPYISQARWEAAQLYIATGDKDQAKKLLEKLLDSADYKDKAKKKLDTL